jgi:hypothetical protein
MTYEQSGESSLPTVWKDRNKCFVFNGFVDIYSVYFGPTSLVDLRSARWASRDGRCAWRWARRGLRNVRGLRRDARGDARGLPRDAQPK